MNKKLDQRLFLCNKRSGDILNPAATKKRAEDDSSSSKIQPKVSAMLSDLHMVTVGEVVLLDLKRPLLSALLEKEPTLSRALDPLLGSHLIDHLRNLDFLQGVSEERESQLQLLSEMCRYEAFREGEVIFEQQEEGQKFYIISQGRCDVRLESDQVRAKRAPLSMMDFILPSPSTRRTREKSGTSAFFDDGEGRRRSSAQRLIEKFLCLSQSSRDMRSRSNADLERRNSGQQRKHVSFEGTTLLGTLSNGDYFGETALMLDIPRTSTVVTCDRCLLISCDKTYFKNFLLVAPGVKEILRQQMIYRLLVGFKSTKLPYLRMFQEHQLNEVAKLCSLEEHKTSEIICRRGEIEPCVYMLVYGQVLLDVPTREPVDFGDMEESMVTGTTTVEVGTGNYFGQESLRDGTLETTAVALSDCVILRMRSGVEQLLLSAEATGSWRILTKQNDCTLHDVLSCFVGFEAMRKLLERELSGENLRFLRVVQKFRKMDDQDPGLRPTILAIVDEFIKAGSPSQVNIEATMREKIITDSKQKVIQMWIFDRCAKEVYNLVERDSFRRFLRTELFQEVLDHLGVRKDLANALPQVKYPSAGSCSMLSPITQKGAQALRPPTHT
eukprot:CAMPEP_0117746600 /NCGR_PEP_ID=MMETSP0947-20121206/8039_1 /TAXON_ID=44440 /ORGANISM="Chattonella subsalsa, Strain CCMP2191" /LENGTH=610 /DNA_ID=CAMNT_0005563947 /DNA_START=496 /DNA_END=2328 /DNA_ORIENTATION=+